MKQEIVNCLTYLANYVAETIAYEDTWSPKFCHVELSGAFSRVNEELSKHLDWSNLTERDCKALRFGKLEEGNPLRLIPIWLYKVIPIGTELTSINGEKVIFNGHNIDLDTRYGCLAYGIIPKQSN